MPAWRILPSPGHNRWWRGANDRAFPQHVPLTTLAIRLDGKAFPLPAAYLPARVVLSL